MMLITRRQFVTGAGAARRPAGMFTRHAGADPRDTHPQPVRVGMTDWNLGQRGDISKVALAREIGLDGIQVSVQFRPTANHQRCATPKTQAAFRRAALDNGIRFARSPSAARQSADADAHSPAFAILLTEAVEVACNIGTNNILLPSSATATSTRRIRRRSTRLSP